MKVLFLDVDGVLNRENTGGIKSLNRKNLKYLEEIVQETNCHIVLSSSWRLSPEFYNHLVKTLKYRNLSIFSTTPNFVHLLFVEENMWEKGQSFLRGYEVQNWLTNRTEIIDSYAIVDDNDEFLNFQKPYYVKTDSNLGLTNENKNKLISILNKEN